MTTSGPIRAFLAAAALCMALAGCGDDDVGDPIPAGKARSLERQLDAIQSDIDEGLCDDATAAIAELRTEVDTLDDDGVGSDVQDAIGDGVDNLGSLADAECEPEEVETTPETVPEPEPVPPPTETTPPPTETTPPPTEEEPPPEDEEEEPEPDEDDGSGQFGPGGVPPGQAKKLEGDD